MNVVVCHNYYRERGGEDQVFEDEFESIKDHYESIGETVCCDRDEEFMKYARDNVVNRTLLQQESTKRFGDVSEAELACEPSSGVHDTPTCSIASRCATNCGY